MERILLGAALALLVGTPAIAQLGSENFPDRKAVTINNAQGAIELSGFSFSNEFQRSNFRLVTNLAWTNVGAKPITAFEVVLRYFDPFNRPMYDGGRWLITGHNSADWTPLGPGQKSGDGTIALGTSEAFTAIVYVRAIRYSDGTVWTSNQGEVEQRVRAALPQLKDVGTLDPGPKKSSGQ